MVSKLLDILTVVFGVKPEKKPEKNLAVLTQYSVKSTFLIKDKSFKQLHLYFRTGLSKKSSHVKILALASLEKLVKIFQERAK